MFPPRLAVGASLLAALALGASQASSLFDGAGAEGRPAAASKARPGADTKKNAAAAYGKLPLRFEANRGQTHGAVDFLARGRGYSVFLTGSEAVLSLPHAQKPPSPASSHGRRDSAGEQRGGAAIRMRLLGSNPSPTAAAHDRLEGKSNYLVGKDKSEWRTGVPGYGKVRYQSVYPGTDVVYYGRQGRLEYDFVLAPGADPKAIALGFGGADRISVDRRGDLVLSTPAGRLRQHRPVIYQRVAGRRRPVSGRYVVRGKRRVGFRVGAYDRTRPLVIDPILSYSTYLGGARAGQGGANPQEHGSGIDVDSSGSAYVTGQTAATDFPTTVGAYDRGCESCEETVASDVFVTKLSPAGEVVYSTYLGGDNTERAGEVSLEPGCSPSPVPSCSAYVSGSTQSTDFPVVGGAQSARRGAADGFVAKLDAGGTALQYSTLLGGSQEFLLADREDSAPSLAVDPSGKAYLSGTTNSSDFPTSASGYDRSCNVGGGACLGADAYLAKLDTTKLGPDSLVYSTYLGGAGSAEEDGTGVAADSTGNAYVTGNTGNVDFPTTAGAYDRLCESCATDAFVAKLDTSKSGQESLVYSTYLGGASPDRSEDIAVDGNGKAYVVGDTGSADFPTTPGAYQTAKRGSKDAFIAKLDPGAAGPSSLVYSTYLGAQSNSPDNESYAYAIAVDPAGSAHLTGETYAEGFPAIAAFEAIYQGGGDAFVAKLSPAGSALDYSTYLGGSGFDSGFAIGLPSMCAAPCHAYVTGQTESSDFPTKNARDDELSGQVDAFVTRLDPTRPPARVPAIQGLSVKTGPVSGGTPVTITGTNFTGATAVKFGDVAARSFSVDSSGQRITTVAPAHSAGVVDISVVGPDASSRASDKTKFLFGLGRWQSTDTLDSPRSGHSATLLPDGKVLVAGGRPGPDFQQGDSASDGAEVYDPKTGAWSPTGSMHTGRAHHTATLLGGLPCQGTSRPDWCGKVLVAGGFGRTASGPPLASVELYDPRATDQGTGRRGAFTTVTASMGSARSQHTATMLSDGRVLLAAGCSAQAACYRSENYTTAPSAEIFRPASNDFASAGSPNYGRVGHSATLLPNANGKVLLVGGTAVQTSSGATVAPAELYDPAGNTWSRTTGTEADPRADHAAVLLPSGKVLVAGGTDGNVYPIFKESAELYDPATEGWRNATPLQAAHTSAPATLLPRGDVLLAAGEVGTGFAGMSELFDPSLNAGRGAWNPALPTLAPRDPGVSNQGREPNHRAVLLSSDPDRFAADPEVCGKNCGKVLVSGGAVAADMPSAELYTPPPTLTAIGPATGPAGGGTKVSITGTGFTHDVSAVRFGTKPAQSFTVNSYSGITAISPPAPAGASVPVTVVNEGGQAVSAQRFAYASAPPGPGTTPGGGGTQPPAGGGPSGGGAPAAGDDSLQRALAAERDRARALRRCLSKARRLRSRRARRAASRRCRRRYGRTPGRVTGLSAKGLSSTKIALSFRAPGSDRGRPPPARAYLIKQSRRPIRSRRAFRRAKTLCRGACRFSPRGVGARLSFTVTGLRRRTTYYYAVVARDNVSRRLGPRSRAVRARTRR